LKQVKSFAHSFETAITKHEVLNLNPYYKLIPRSILLHIFLIMKGHNVNAILSNDEIKRVIMAVPAWYTLFYFYKSSHLSYLPYLCDSNGALDEDLYEIIKKSITEYHN
jgi:hypothetical protein